MTITLLAAASLAIWLYLVLARAQFWRADQRLAADHAAPTGEAMGNAWPSVAVVIPARNEAESIERVVLAHQASDYPGDLSITVVDDASDDGTGDLARGARGPRARQVGAAPGPGAGGAGQPGGGEARGGAAPR
ncbi:MAG: glycosyltransferase, partial [Pseudomonadota bacterium]